MATTKSKKALCHLVCQASSEVSEEVLKQELDRNTDDLLNGILTHSKPTPASLAAFTSNKKGANKLTSFITIFFFQRGQKISNIVIFHSFNGTVCIAFVEFLRFFSLHFLLNFSFLSSTRFHHQRQNQVLRYIGSPRQ